MALAGYMQYRHVNPLHLLSKEKRKMFTDDKAREMGRSILPSKRRRAHQEQHRLSRRRRHHDRQVLKRMHRDGVEWDDVEDHLIPPKLDRDMKWLVQDRRDADHLNHFYRWSEAVTESLEPRDRLAVIRAILPEGLIGQHAISHLEMREHFMVPGAIVGNWYGDRKREREYRKRKAIQQRYVERLMLVAQAGLLADFEKTMLDAVQNHPVPSYMMPTWNKRDDGTTFSSGKRRVYIAMPQLTCRVGCIDYSTEKQIQLFVEWVFKKGWDGKTLAPHRQAMRHWLKHNNF